ncbi:MAG TPA: sigma-54 dependent transcriptional regulator [candidate division Zixibacteria bacterium]|nr:sigma-54 dependent transcriptional regulator [candidate division Zixibacteria bacterium]
MHAAAKTRVLVINEDEALARFLSSYLVRREFEISTASSGDEAIRAFRVYDPAMVLLDLTMKGSDAMEVLEKLKQIKPEVAVIVISATQQPESIFRASKLGADDFVAKPFDPKDLDMRIHKLVEKQRLSSEVTQLRDQVRRQADFSMLFGTSPKMEDVKNTIEQVADTNATVLIRGESGTGKEVVARMIYSQSGRHDNPFVKVNCAAIPHELLESELFGYEAGAFTGATRQKLGKFELANTGTLFLDEVSEMHPALQAKLLHVLQDGEFSRLGGKRDIAVDVRVLAATNKQLERAVEEGMFREDLFYRLNVVTVHIPPLRERREEIPIFLDFFLRKYSAYYGKQPHPFTDYAVNRMIEYNWPGNIRELENLVKRYVIVGNESQIIRELSTHKPLVSSVTGATPWPGRDKPIEIPKAAGSSPGNGAATMGVPNAAGEIEMPSLLEIGRRAAMQAEREAIERVLTQTRWNRRQAAKILKISYKALLNKLKLMEESNSSTNKSQIA